MYSIGLDYGTESCRGVLLDLTTKEIVDMYEMTYPNGVITKYLDNRALKQTLTLQHPEDYEIAITQCVRQLLTNTGIEKENILGIGIGFTSCTMLPVTVDFTPLCYDDSFKEEPHAYAKLWKSHSADKEASMITEALQNHPFIARYGGIISSEWLLPKVLETIHDAPHVYERAAYFMEAGDWLVSTLTGQLQRSSCMAGYKGTWQNPEGYLDSSILKGIHPDLENIYRHKLAGKVQVAGKLAGYLTEYWASKLGLTTKTKVSISMIDAHTAVVGAGVSKTNEMLIVVGTSSCHLMLTNEQVLIPGISGVVKDGIYEGLYAYEAGQVAVGDIFSHFVKQQVPSYVVEQAKMMGKNIFELLTEQMSALKVGQSGIVALDWYNGNRTPYVNPNLSAVIVGETIFTEPHEKFRALIESTAFGTKRIVELFEEQGIKIERIILTGGIPQKNKELVQIYADVLQKELVVVEQDHIPALGAAILGAAVALDLPLIEAVKIYHPKNKRQYKPNVEVKVAYETLYDCYKELSEYFTEHSSILSVLNRLKS